jgi:hypothetical protein
VVPSQPSAGKLCVHWVAANIMLGQAVQGVNLCIRRAPTACVGSTLCCPHIQAGWHTCHAQHQHTVEEQGFQCTKYELCSSTGRVLYKGLWRGCWVAPARFLVGPAVCLHRKHCLGLVVVPQGCKHMAPPVGPVHLPGCSSTDACALVFVWL